MGQTLNLKIPVGVSSITSYMKQEGKTAASPVTSLSGETEESSIENGIFSVFIISPLLSSSQIQVPPPLYSKSSWLYPLPSSILNSSKKIRLKIGA